MAIFKKQEKRIIKPLRNGTNLADFGLSLTSHVFRWKKKTMDSSWHDIGNLTRPSAVFNQSCFSIKKKKWSPTGIIFYYFNIGASVKTKQRSLTGMIFYYFNIRASVKTRQRSPTGMIFYYFNWRKSQNKTKESYWHDMLLFQLAKVLKQNKGVLLAWYFIISIGERVRGV